VPDDPTVLLTIAGMLQFKPVFLGQAQPPQNSQGRVTTSQKCLRCNDVDNVGRTARHHTFFEMLGAFSFGSGAKGYFKREAIEMAWELSTQVLGLDPTRLWVSVYRDDDESYALWRDVIGVPESRLRRLGEADNFWASGPTGPCGPCTELYYDFAPEEGEGTDVTLEDDVTVAKGKTTARFVEFYNLVFMQYNRDAAGVMSDLAAPCVDTGMGLERVAAILQGSASSIETDLLLPVVRVAARRAGLEDRISVGGAAGDPLNLDALTSDQRLALRVVADHARAVLHLVADGVVPSNVGRGYVARRLLRRISMKARVLGIDGPFLREACSAAADLVSPDVDPTLSDPSSPVRARCFAEIEREEAAFARTLANGEKLLAELCEAGDVSGDDAFLLYDTFGFPLECTVEEARSRFGRSVDEDGFAAAMTAQRERARAGAKGAADLTDFAALAAVRDATGATTSFLGYGPHEGGDGGDDGMEGGDALGLKRRGCVVLALCAASTGDRVDSLAAEADDEVDVVLDRTPFYAESGGQVSDVGTLVTDTALLRVVDVQKCAGGDLFRHRCVVETGAVTEGQTCVATVDASRRARIRANHTATHLLQRALKIVLGDGVAQQGSLVTPDRLRFDFNAPEGLTREQIGAAEDLVNGWIGEGHALVTESLSMADAKARGATMMAGERYGDVVRVVDVPGVSMELCGGTHVATTAEIRGLKIVSEAGIASGVRRVEAVTGEGMLAHHRSVDATVAELSARLKTPAEDLAARVERLQADVRAAQREADALRSQLALARADALVSRAEPVPGAPAPAPGRPALVRLVARLDGLDGKGLQDAALSLQGRLGDAACVLLGSAAPGDDGKVALAAAFGPDAVRAGAKAGGVVGPAAKVCGGGGGGKPNVAQAGGRDASRLDEALAAGADAIAAALAG